MATCECLIIIIIMGVSDYNLLRDTYIHESQPISDILQYLFFL